MKEAIMEKLFASKELTNEECIYVGRNLTGNDESIPFDHDNKSSLTACGLCEEDVTAVNKKFRELSDQDLNMSRMVEVVEGMSLSSEKTLRMVVFQAIRASLDREIMKGGLSGMPGIPGMKSLDLPDELIQLLMKKLFKKGGNNGENSQE